MGPKTAKLHKLLEEAAVLMRSVEENHWASWLEKDAACIRASDFYGIEHFCAAFGGMGSITDLVIHPMNHHRVAESGINQVNEQLKSLLGQAYKLAHELRHEATIDFITAPEFRVFNKKGGTMDQVEFYEAKLKFETDSWDLSESLKEEGDVVVIDARSTEAYEMEHIPSAISMPHRVMSEETTRDLDRSKTYVTYCDGIGCNASTKGALKLARLGFNVKELLGGLDWWKRDGYATEGKAGNEGKSITCNC